MSDYATHTSLMDARGDILEALRDEMERRKQNPDTWEMRERLAVVLAANKYASTHELRGVTVSDVFDIEHLSMGHIDYAEKLALHVSQFIHGLSVLP